MPALNLPVNPAAAGSPALDTAEGTSSAMDGQEEQGRLQAGGGPVVFLHVVFEAAQQERRAEDKQGVGDDRARDGGFHQHVLPGTQRGDRYDQFGQVAERGVEQAANRIARLRRHRLGGDAATRPAVRSPGPTAQRAAYALRA